VTGVASVRNQKIGGYQVASFGSFVRYIGNNFVQMPVFWSVTKFI